MLIACTNLATRFYVRDGWTMDLVLSYVNLDRTHCSPNIHTMDHNMPELQYFIPAVGTIMDCERLIEDGHKVSDYFAMDHIGWTDLEILKDKQI